MTLTDAQVATAARALARAEANRQPIDPLTDELGPIDVEDAYRIQEANLSRRLAEGEQIVGVKAGLTSRAMQRMLGVDQPDFGHLFASMARFDRGVVELDQLIAPRVEAEIAFVMASELSGPAPTVDEVLAATEAVVPALEIVDSRVADWRIQIGDTIADNASCGRFVLSDERTEPDGLDLRLLGMVFSKNGAVIDSGAGGAVLGHPARSVCWLAATLWQAERPLRAGDVVLTGALHRMVEVTRGDVFEAEFAGLGHVRVSFE